VGETKGEGEREEGKSSHNNYAPDKQTQQQRQKQQQKQRQQQQKHKAWRRKRALRTKQFL